MVALLIVGCRPVDPVEPVVAGHPSHPPAHPNVLVILLDDMGTDKVSAYGEQADASTPTLDGLASEGVLFRNAWASSVCSPSRGMLLTGRYGRRYGLGLNVDDSSPNWEIPDREVLIPEMLDPAGYTSLALGKWHLSPALSPTSVLDSPLRQGFATHRGSAGNLWDQYLDDTTVPNYSLWEKSIDGVRSFSTVYATTDLVNDAIREIPDAPEPWFAYLAFNAPHGPYHVPPDGLDVTGATDDSDPATLSRAMVGAADLEIARLLDALDPEVRARTTIFALGDNGSPGVTVGDPFDPGHGKVTMFEGGVRVPLIVSGPDVSLPGSESEALVHVVDLFATIAEIAETDLSDLAIDGQSLVPFLRDPARPGREWVYTERLAANGAPPWPNEQLAIRDRRYKLIRNGTRESLFDMEGRIDEGPDLLDDAPVDREAAAAHEQLGALLDQVIADLPYEY